MTNPIDAIGNRVSPACDTTAPPTLEVRAEYGDLTVPSAAGSARVDPLIIHFDHVEPGTAIEFLNRSARPDASWSDASHRQLFPVGDNWQSLPNGKVTVALGNEAARGLGIQPGDVLEFRQVDPAGNASWPRLLKLDQSGGGDGMVDAFPWRLPVADRFELGGTNLGAAQNYYLLRYGDDRAPVVIPGRMSWSRGSSIDTRSLSGERALEPDAVVSLQNQRTGAIFVAKADDEGRFDLQFTAECGDPVSVSVRDRHGQSTALGGTSLGFEGPHPH